MTGFQVHEAVNFLLHQDTILNANLLFVDLQVMSFNQIPLHKNPQCPVCSGKKEKLDLQITEDYYSIDLCGDNSFMVVPERSVDFNFQNVQKSLTKEYRIIKKGKLAFTIQYSENTTITIFQGGNALFKGLESKESVLTVWKEIQKKGMR
jgi:hypothetical protein